MARAHRARHSRFDYGAWTMSAAARAWGVLEEAAAWAAARGALLFHLDLAIELARDALSPTERGGGELVAVADAEGYAVAAVEDGLSPKVRAIVRFDEGRVLVTPGGAPAPSLLEAMATAKRTVGRAAPIGPGLPAATLVAPPTAPGAPLDAYAFRLAGRPGDLVLGAHWRLRLSPDGRAVTAREPLSRAAATVAATGGRLPGSVALAHPGPCPNEAHHYLSLKHGVALDVLALDSASWWRVEGGRSEPHRRGV